MKLYQKILASGALITTLGLNGCGNSGEDYNENSNKNKDVLEGIVKEEFGTAHLIIESSKDSCREGIVPGDKLNYGFVLQNEGEKYFVNIEINSFYSGSLLSLAKIVEPGDSAKIFNVSNFNEFSILKKKKFGNVCTGDIEIIKRE